MGHASTHAGLTDAGPGTDLPVVAAAAAARRGLRLVFAAGPGDIIGTFRHWREGRDDPGQVAMTYSGQFFDVCRELGAAGYAIASHPRRERVRDGAFVVEHRPIAFAKSRAPLYHLGQVWSAVRLVISAVRFRADVLIVYDGTCHWFPLRVLPRVGTRVIPTFFCTLWRRNAPPPGRIARLIRRLDRPFWRRSASAALSMSGAITRQLDQLTAGQHQPVIEFLPTYRPGTFPDAAAEPPAHPPGPFRVLYAGRIERFKGVFDLLEVARRLAAEGRTDIEFDLCGNGTAFDELARQVAADPAVAPRFRLHGHRTRPQMHQMFRDCHVLVVPTRSEFAEGFNQVVAEGVLAGRPVITSEVCPAIEYVRDAIIEVPPDDVATYQNAIVRLAGDRELYERKRQACRSLQPQFYDVARGWSAALRQALALALPGHAHVAPAPPGPPAVRADAAGKTC